MIFPTVYYRYMYFMCATIYILHMCCPDTDVMSAHHNVTGSDYDNTNLLGGIIK